MSTTCRLAGPADSEELLERLDQWHRLDGLRFEAALAQRALLPMLAAGGQGHLWLVERRGQVIGYAALSFRAPLGSNPPAAYMSALWLIPDWRGRGIGAQVRNLMHDVGRFLQLTVHEFDTATEAKHGAFLQRRAALPAGDGNLIPAGLAA